MRNSERHSKATYTELTICYTQKYRYLYHNYMQIFEIKICPNMWWLFWNAYDLTILTVYMCCDLSVKFHLYRVVGFPTIVIFYLLKQSLVTVYVLSLSLAKQNWGCIVNSDTAYHKKKKETTSFMVRLLFQKGYL